MQSPNWTEILFSIATFVPIDRSDDIGMFEFLKWLVMVIPLCNPDDLVLQTATGLVGEHFFTSGISKNWSVPS